MDGRIVRPVEVPNIACIVDERPHRVMHASRDPHRSVVPRIDDRAELLDAHVVESKGSARFGYFERKAISTMSQLEVISQFDHRLAFNALKREAAIAQKQPCHSILNDPQSKAVIIVVSQVPLDPTDCFIAAALRWVPAHSFFVVEHLHDRFDVVKSIRPETEATCFRRYPQFGHT